MRKKIIPKRKAKQALNKLIFLGVVFISTFGILMLFFLLFSLKKHPILNPSSFTKTENPQIVQNSNPDLIKSLLEKENIAVKQTKSATDSSTLVILENDEEIVFSNNKNIRKQIASLQLIMRQITIEGRRFKRIDFRFDNPVISF